tara:strand:+ start:1071 stop:1352 length:282 start_codon:yes stop_codon:yes gene_type:complete
MVVNAQKIAEAIAGYDLSYTADLYDQGLCEDQVAGLLWALEDEYMCTEDLPIELISKYTYASLLLVDAIIGRGSRRVVSIEMMLYEVSSILAS